MTNIHGRPIEYYLRSYRQHAHLSQEELAYLLGAATAAKVSRYESGNRIPSLETGLAYEAALGEPVAKLFHGRYEEIRELVEERRRKMRAEKERRKAKVAAAIHSVA